MQVRKKVLLCYPGFLDGLVAAMVSSKNVCFSTLGPRVLTL